MPRHSSAVAPAFFLAALLVFGITPAHAQSTTQAPAPEPPSDPPAATTATQAASDDDGRLDPLEPDFVLVNLPTTLRLPVGAGNFHLTHRFNDNLRGGTFDDHLSGLFGLDSGANIGLEFRFGVMRHLEAIVQRTSIGRTIQFSGKYDAMHQDGSHPVSLTAIVAVEGDNNFRAHHAPTLGVVVSREVGGALAVYVEPFWVHNTANEGLPTRDTAFLGVGARVRLGSTVNFVGEISPRVGGLVILGDPLCGFGLEKRVGAHVFTLTFTNRAATTFRQIAQGGTPDYLTLGFNLTRKFF